MDNTTNEGTSMEDDDDIVTLKIGNSEINCSRQTLSENSDYFNAMFQSQMKESNATTIELKEVDSDAVRNVFEFMKTGHCELSLENIESVTETACMYQLKDMIGFCCNYMETNLADTSCLTILILADTFSLNSLYNKARQHFVWFFNQVTKTTDFLSVDNVDVMVDLLNDKLLNVTSEMEVFLALERWIQYQFAERRSHVRKVMKCVHVEDLTHDEINILRNNELLRDCPDCLACNREEDVCMKMKYRHTPHVLLLVGGEKSVSEDDTLEPYQDILKYDSDLGVFDTSRPYTDLRDVHSNAGLDMGYSVCTNGKNIYVSGGEVSRGRNSWNYSVWCFDTFEHTWDKVTKLQSPRRHHATCVQEDNMYFVGGFGKFRVKLDSVEKFNLNTEKWDVLAPLPEHTFSLGLCVCGNKIFAFKEQIHCYNPPTNVWTTLIRDSNWRFAASCLMCYGNLIFCMSKFSNKLLCFNTVDNSLECVGDFQCAESASVNAVIHDNKVIKAGFLGSESLQLEWYDPVCRAFGTHSVKLSGVSLSNFYLVSIPVISDFK